MKTAKELGNMIREYRTKKGLTQLELAQHLGYNTTQFVSLFERGLSKTPVEALGKLIIILGIPEAKVLKILMTAHKDKLIEEISAGKDRALKITR